MITHTESEILSQPEVWQQTLEGLESGILTKGFGAGVREVIVTGCGSTHYLALTVASLLRMAGVPASAAPASELLADSAPRLASPTQTLMLAFSRSGTTTETLLAVENFRRLGGAHVVTVTVYPDSPLAAASDVVHAAPAAIERSVAQTRSFSSMLLLGQAIAMALADEDLAGLSELPAHAQRLLESSRAAMAQAANAPQSRAFYFLASDPLFGVASEGMLKLKEMSLTDSEAYHSMEFRHGPMSMCDEGAVVLGLISPQRAVREMAVLKDIEAQTGRVLVIGDGLDHDVPARLSRFARPALYLMPLQLLALERALGKGLDPDNPRNLTAVIHLDEN